MKNKTQINDAEQDQSDRANKIHSKKQEYFNRSSPMKIVRLYKHMSPSQRKLLQAYGFGSLLDIKCSKLQPQLCKYLMEHFNPDTCQLEFGARGSIPVTEEAVHKVLGIPMGREPVVHELSIDAISFMLDQLGIQNGTQPKIVDIEKELAGMNAADERYLRLWLMYVICSVLAPTTGTRVSPRCYPSLLDTRRIPALNWCRFVITMLIKAAKDKDKKNIFKACMPFLMIFYIDSLDIKNMEVNKRGKRICVWTNKMVKTAVALDTLEDGEFGMLPLKNKFRNRETILFGDQTVIDKFVRDNVPENCTPRDVARYRTAAQEMCNDFQGILATFIRNCSARDSAARPSCSKKKSTAERCYARSRLVDNTHKKKERPVYEDGLSVSESSPDTSDMGYDGESDENECESDMGNDGESDANESESEDISLDDEFVSQPHDHQGPYCQERVLQQGQTNDVLPRRKQPSPYIEVKNNHKRVHEDSDSEYKYHKRKNYGSRHHMSKPAGTSRDSTTLQKQHRSYAKAEGCTQSTINGMDIKPLEHGRDGTQKQVNVKNQEGSNAGHKRQHMKKFDTSKIASDDTRATEGVMSRKTVQKYRERSGRSQCFEGASHSVFKQEQPTVKQPDGIRKTKRSKGPVKPTTISCTQLGVNESKREIVKAVEVNRKEQCSLSAARQLLEQLRMYSADSHSSDEDITNGAPRSWPDVGKEPSTGLPVSLPHGTNEPGCSSEGIIGGQNSHILVWDAQNNEVAAVTRSMSPLSISKGIHALDGKQVSQDRQAKPHQSPPMRCKTLAHAEIASASREPSTLNNGNSVSPRSSVTYAVTRSMSPLAISKRKGSCHGKGNAESQEQLENIAQSTLKSQENVTAAVTASSSMEPAGTSDTNQEHTPHHSGHKTEIRSNTNQSAAISNDSSISRQLNFDSAESERASQRQHLIADCPSFDLSIDGTPADVNHKPDNVTDMSGTQIERREAIPAECITPPDPLVISSSDEDEVLLIPIQAIRNSSPVEDYIAMSQPKDLGRGGVDDSVEIVTTKLNNTSHIAANSFDQGSTSTTTPIVAQGSNTPVPQPHQKRAVRAGKMQKFVVSEHTRKLYDAVCRHAKKSPPIKDETIIIDFGSYFIYLYDLADSVEPEGKLSNSTCEIALHILKQEMLPERKFVMPLRITQYLTEGSFKHKELEKIFKFSQSNHLDESELIMFPRMLTLPHDENNKNKHYYLIVLNLKAKRFEVLDSLNLETQPVMIEDCNQIVTSIRNCWATKYSQPSTGIQDYPIEHVDAPQQETRYDCGYFMLKYIELWDGRNVTYYFKQSDMPNIRMLYTEKWVNWVQNKVKCQTLLSMESDS